MVRIPLLDILWSKMQILFFIFIVNDILESKCTKMLRNNKWNKRHASENKWSLRQAVQLEDKDMRLKRVNTNLEVAYFEWMIKLFDRNLLIFHSYHAILEKETIYSFFYRYLFVVSWINFVLIILKLILNKFKAVKFFVLFAQILKNYFFFSKVLWKYIESIEIEDD